MQLLSQVAGALVAGALVSVLAWQAGMRIRRAMAAAVFVPVVVAGLLALPNLRDASDELLDQRKANASLTSEEAQLQGGVIQGVDVAFLKWADERFDDGDTFHLVIGDSPNWEAVRQWSLFQLAPHLATGEAADADWIVFYDSSAEEFRPGTLEEPLVYAPGFEIARNIGAG
jgi:hypothetical protein